ncbi:hypothetical protein [Rhizobium sp.]|uniref:hypothetical protein n=1 Tax=Rhizobium sp. TaxID=391 RepID=UPI0028AA6D7F
MDIKQIGVAVSMTAGLALAPASPHAEDAEWGCQILLCAASQSPSWHGVPYCVPPMSKLITAMAKPHFSWPVCHAANSGKPGHQEYEDCPVGIRPAPTPSGRDSDGLGGAEMSQCFKIVNQCRDRSAFRSQYGDQSENARNGITVTPVQDNSDHWTGNRCEVRVSQPRPRKADPYYFDIPDENGTTKRVWFNLDL